MNPPDPKDAESVAGFALDCLDHLDEDAGLAALEPALEYNPQDARLWQAAGLLWRSVDNLNRACEAFDRAAASAPQDARIAHGRARSYLDAGRPASALFSRAQALAPGDGQVTLGWAASEVAQRRLSRAIDLIEQRCLTVDPAWADGLVQLAKLHWMAGDHEDFAVGLRFALDRFPHELELWRQYLALLMGAGRFEEVVEFVGSHKTASENAVIKVFEAAALAEMGDHRRAGLAFSHIDLSSDFEGSIYFVRHLLRSRQFGDAANFAQKWLGTKAEDNFVPYLATAWRMTGDPRSQRLTDEKGLVAVFDLASEVDLAGLVRVLEHLQVFNNQPLDQSLRTGSQTDGYLFAREEPIIQQLRAACAATVARHASVSGRVRFSGAWSVRLTAGGHHANHVHPGGAWSSAFYVALPDGVDQSPTKAGWLQLGQPPTELGLDLPPTTYVQPKPGRLVLFPSTMWHGTVPFDSGERMTVAFDVAKPVVSDLGTSR